MRLSITLLLLLLPFLKVLGQKINPEIYNKVVFNSTFVTTVDFEIWPTVNNPESVYLIRNNEYSMKRKSTDPEKYDFIFPDTPFNLPVYQIQAGLKLISTKVKGTSVGFCYNFNRDKQAGYVFEFNSNQQFRISKWDESRNRSYLTGTSAKNSWRIYKVLKSSEQLIDLRILVQDNLAEVYIDGFLLFSYDDSINYPERNFGLYISPGCEASCKYVRILTDSNYLRNLNPEKAENKVKGVLNPAIVNTSSDVKKPLDLIVSLKNDIARNEKEIANLNILLGKCKEDNLTLKDFISKNIDTKINNKLAALEKEVATLKGANDKLLAENKVLIDFKTMTTSTAKNKDIVDLLYEQIKKLETEKAQLIKKNESLQKELKKVRGY